MCGIRTADFAKAERSTKIFPKRKYRESKRGNLSPPMVTAFTRNSFPTLKLYFKTSTTGETSESKQDEANRCETKPSDMKYSGTEN